MILTNGNCSTTSDCFIVAGISHSGLKWVEVYPNPFTNTLNLSHVEHGARIELFSIDGRLVYQTSYDGEAIVFSNQTGFVSGIYTVKISTSTGSTFRKVLKQ